MPRIAPSCLVVGLLGVAACALRPAAPAVSAEGPAARHGTIVAIRPLTRATGVGVSILAAVGSPIGEPDGGDVEVILRAEDGQTVSVVQASDTRFQVGERVALTPGALTQVVTVAPGR